MIAGVVFVTDAKGDRSGSLTPKESNCRKRPASFDLERNWVSWGVAILEGGEVMDKLLVVENDSRFSQ